MSFGFGFAFPALRPQAWSPLVLWPLGASSPGMWIDGPSYPASCFQDSAGATALSTVGTVLDSSNPVGLVLDRKGNLQLGPELVTTPYSCSGTGWTATTNTLARVLTGASAVGTFTSASDAVIGKRYLVSFTASGLSGATCYANYGAAEGAAASKRISTAGNYSFYMLPTAASPLQFVPYEGADYAVTISNVSIKEIPGLHLSQSTSPARPVASGRFNLLISTEDLTNASAWPRSGGAATPNASTITFAATGDYIYQTASGVTANMPTASRLLLSGTGTITINFFDAGGAAETQLTLTGTPTWYTLTRTASGSAVNLSIQIIKRAGDTAASVTCGGIQMNLGPTALPYQRVGAASDYTATGFPVFAKFDSVDDALASATFAAGTLTSSMDCLIAVRRDSASQVVIFYQTAGGSAYVIASPGAGSGAFQNAGSPTVWVDGTQLSGGTSVTAGTLHTALTPGAWHILECRGLDLSAWTAFGVGNWLNTYQLNGALGKIQLFAAGQDANRNQARAVMAAYFGVTLA